jgi:hypothetical protein
MVTDSRIGTDMDRIVEILDRDQLSEQQTNFLAADILVGDVNMADYLIILQKASPRVAANATKVLKRAGVEIK